MSESMAVSWVELKILLRDVWTAFLMLIPVVMFLCVAFTVALYLIVPIAACIGLATALYMWRYY